jgi:hypothetical protein
MLNFDSSHTECQGRSILIWTVRIRRKQMCLIPNITSVFSSLVRWKLYLVNMIINIHLQIKESFPGHFHLHFYHVVEGNVENAYSTRKV